MRYIYFIKRHTFRTRRNGFIGREFSVSNIREDAAGKVIFISQTTDFHFANYRFSFRKLQISISQSTDFHFANYRFPFRKLQIPISQTTDSHFHFVSSHFVSQTTVSPIGGFQVDLAGGSLPLIIRLELKQNPFSFESRYSICLHMMENHFAHQLCSEEETHLLIDVFMLHLLHQSSHKNLIRPLPPFSG